MAYVTKGNIKIDRKAKADTTEDSNFQWTDEHQKVFNLLKAHLTSTPVLGYLDFSHPFDLEMDASLQGLGGCSLPEGLMWP